MFLSLYFLTVALSAYVCARMARRGEWKTGFFCYCLFLNREIFLLPQYTSGTHYTDWYWPCMALSLPLIGWTLGEIAEVPYFIGPLVGLVGGFAVLNGRYEAYNFVAYAVALFAAYAVLKSRSFAAYGILLIGGTEAICMGHNVFRDYGPVIATVLAQIVWSAYPPTRRISARVRTPSRKSSPAIHGAAAF